MDWKMTSIIGAFLLVSGTAAVMQQEQKEATSPHKKGRTFAIVGYLPHYRMAAFEPSEASLLTDIILFSAAPKPSGELDTTRLTPDAILPLHDRTHRAKARLLLALGGWGHSQGFGPVATDPARRRAFVQALSAFCRKNRLDGADFDWEHPASRVEEEGYAALLTETKAAFRPHGLLVTVTLAAWQNLPPSVFQTVDRVQVMAYDHDGPRHSTLEQAIADVNTLLNKGVPREKLCLGTPFYGRDMKEWNRALTYAEIVSKYHPTPEADEAGGIYFNGIATIQAKTRYALDSGLAGIMAWELGQDTTDDTSLLRAIHAIVVK